MDIHHLPQDIFSDNPLMPDDIIFHPYKAPANSFRGKCILHRNAISLVLSGTKTMHFADKTVRIKSDEIHFLSIGNCMVTMELAKGVTVESILIFFDNKVLADFHLRFKERIEGLRGKGEPGVEPFLAFKKDGFINSYIASLQVLLQSGLPVSSEMKRLKFEELMLYLLEKYPSGLLAFPLSKNRDLEDLEIRKAVETNVMTGVSLEELAFICNLSLSTFKRRFIAIYGMAPGKWFLQQRMEMAKEMIVRDGERPADIYHKFGYETHSSFSQSFKQHFGVSPRELKH
jgi:AraC-like DNA-binding protein